MARKILCTAMRGLKVNPIIAPMKTFLRNSSVTTWNKDWQPGPWPRTKEARTAAAHKYNMIPEDYEPYPEDEGFGDYPMFKMFHIDRRNPFEAYDYSVLARNYGEPLHPDYDMCLGDRIDFQEKFDPPLWKQALLVMAIFATYWGIAIYSNTHPIDQHKVPKQYPYSGEIHYTFDADD